MKKFLLNLAFKYTISMLLACLIVLTNNAANAQQIQNFPIPGYATINGTHLNKIVERLNNITGYQTNSSQPLRATTGTFTGLLTGSAGLTLTGTTSASGITCATATPATATDSVFFVATRAFRVVTISEIHAVAAGGASVLQVVKDTGTTAPGAGTDLLTNNTNTGFDLNATANTVQVGTLVATAGVTSLAAGDRLSYDFANAIQSSVGVAVTACMAPI